MENRWLDDRKGTLGVGRGAYADTCDTTTAQRAVIGSVVMYISVINSVSSRGAHSGRLRQPSYSHRVWRCGWGKNLWLSSLRSVNAPRLGNGRGHEIAA